MVPCNKDALSLLSCRMSLPVYMSVSSSEALCANMSRAGGLIRRVVAFYQHNIVQNRSVKCGILII